MAEKFVKRPVEIEAVQWTGENYEELSAFAGRAVAVLHKGHPRHEVGITLTVAKAGDVVVKCDEPGVWIIREPDGSGFYPCSKESFEATYEPSEERIRREREPEHLDH